MVGQRYVALERGAGGRGTLPVGGEIPLNRTTPALDLTELFNGFKPLFQALSPTDVNQLSGEIVQVLQGEGGTVEELLAHTGSLTTTLASRDRLIGEVITNLNHVLGTVNSKGTALTTLISTLRELVSGLAADRAVIGDAIGGLGDLSTATAGLLGSARTPLKDSITGLDAVTKNLADENTLPGLEQTLGTLPEKLNKLGGISSYGSWMNFYLCSSVLETLMPPRGTPVTAKRCGA
jgi:phospholipid/cholesterol/gamma-HCH transport system substrate-binding protein